MYAKSIHIDTQTKEIYFMLKSKRNEKLKFVKLFLIENHVVFLVLNKARIIKQTYDNKTEEIYFSRVS